MKIDKYIIDLNTERNELKDKYNKMQLSTDRNLKTGIDPLFDKKLKIRMKLIETTEKLIFLKNLRKAMIDNEMQNKENRQR